MKNKLMVVVIFVCFIAAQPVHSFEGPEHTYASLLASLDNDKIVLGAQSLYYGNIKNTELLDIVAEIMWHGSNEHIAISSDCMAWLAKALGQSKLARYSVALKSVDEKMARLEKEQPYNPVADDDEEEDYGESRPVNKEVNTVKTNRPIVNHWWSGTMISWGIDAIHSEVNHTKVRKHIKKALENMTNESQGSFVVGKMEHTVLLGKIKNSLIAGMKNRDKIDFIDVKKGTHITELYRQVGLPDKPSIYYVKQRKAFVGIVVTSRLQVEYGDAGYVQLIRDSDEGPGWFIHKIVSFKPDGLAKGLLTQDSVKLRSLARAMYEGNIIDTNILDIAAKRVWDSKDKKSKFTDALAWLCKGIGKSGNPRYRAILEKISATAKNLKIKKYASLQLDLIKETDVQQYVMTSQ